ncbi:hypothetical protein PUR61_00015, partial [Streptomyces sp. BE20]|uniref:hypothetical protein n=1 Tax=Streptomyces sp. BE20 TaxID=3002525 RepID=UPI002E77F10C
FVVGGEALPADMDERSSPGRTVMQHYRPTHTPPAATQTDPHTPPPPAPPPPPPPPPPTTG